MRRALVPAALVVLALAAYSNSFQTPFLMDNQQAIADDTRVHAVTGENLRLILTREYWANTSSSLYRPFTTLTYLFNYAVLGNGTDSAGYHWFNLLLHVANMLLVYALGRALFRQVPAAFLMAAVWGLHPVQTESVTNIVGRADMLAAFGVLAALLCHMRAAGASGGRKAAWVAALALAVTMGVFSKESAAVAAAVILLYDFTFGRGVAWRARIPSYIAAVAPGLAMLYARSLVLANAPFAPFPFVENPLMGASFWSARMTAFKVIGRYFLLLVWPARLSNNYYYNEIPLFAGGAGGWEDAKAVLALLMCVALAVVAIRAYRRDLAVFFWIALFFLALAPASNLVLIIGSIMGERFLYLPAVGFAGCVAWLLQAAWRRWPALQARPRYALAAVGVLLLALGARTYARNLDWADGRRFWDSALEAAPGSYLSNIAVAGGMDLATAEGWNRASQGAARALAILDGLPDVRNSGFAYYNIGTLYLAMGERLATGQSVPGSNATGAAAAWYRKALEALLRSEMIERAKEELSRREGRRRGRPPIRFVTPSLYLQIGRAYLRLSDPANALAAFARGRAMAPDPDLLEEMSQAYRASGDLRAAALALVEAMAVDPRRASLSPRLIDLYRRIDPQGCAVAADGSLNIECPLVRNDICAASREVSATYQREGHTSEAETVRRVATMQLGCAPESVQ